MTLYESWITKAYSKNGQSIKRVWDIYMPLEQKIYEQMLENKQPHILGTVLELSEKHNMSVEFICGFLDGIKESLANGSFVDIERLENTTMIDVYVDFEKLYRKMVEYKAEHLYTLPQWHNIFTPEIRKELYANQKKSGTIVREKDKIGRNDPCPCGSGKKFKKCCSTALNDIIYNETLVQE